MRYISLPNANYFIKVYSNGGRTGAQKFLINKFKRHIDNDTNNYFEGRLCQVYFFM